MKLLVNYSEPARELLAEKRIAFDYFKTPDWESIVGPATKVKPVQVHFAVNLGDVACWTYDRKAIKEWLKRTGTRYVNTHAAPTLYDLWIFDPKNVTPVQLANAKARLDMDLGIYIDEFGADRLTVENVPYWGRGVVPNQSFVGTLPEIMSHVVTHNKVGLLLDFAHARITANALGMDVKEYISALPVQSLRELHVSGVQEIDGRLRDHMALQDADWELVSWGMEQIRAGRWAKPWAIALEYGGVGEKFEWRSDKGQLATQVERLRELIKGL